MAVSSSRGRTTEVLMSRKWKESRETSPERTKVWIEPSSTKVTTQKKVPVVYYLCRNGQLEQPHFMEVPLSSPEGLYLRDVINRLNFLRGKGMATMYSWSSKRGYKNGFVWHDLSESDFIYPASGKEYVLKGSELLDGGSLISKSNDPSFSSSFRKPPPETRPSGDDSDFPATVTRRRNQSWSAIDLHEYQVYKAESTGESSAAAAADASTQTDDKRRRRRPIREIEEEEREDEEEKQTSRELSSEEISITPPASDSSPETLETLMKADGRLVLCPPGEISNDRTADNHPSGRHKASTVLMQLISCGSMSFKDCGATSAVKDPRFSLISHYKARLPRGGGGKDQVGKGAEEGAVENPRFEVVIGRGGNNNSKMMEDKEYFSGSLIETKKDEFAFAGLKRSNSYNADRTSNLELTEKGTEGMKAKCIPRKPKTPTTN